MEDLFFPKLQFFNFMQSFKYQNKDKIILKSVVKNIRCIYVSVCVCLCTVCLQREREHYPNKKQLDVCLSVCLKLKILVTTEPIGFYSSGYIPIGPVVFKLYSWGVGHPPSTKQMKISLPTKKKCFLVNIKLQRSTSSTFKICIISWGKAQRLGAKPLVLNQI